jgi:acyl-CoA synthetase (NDP forming)
VEDFVEYMSRDANTRVIVMIVEQFRHPKRFLALAQMARAAGKQVLLLHPGSSSAARVSAATHTGAIAGNYEVMRCKVGRSGVLVANTLEELVDIADVLVRCPAYGGGGAVAFTESGAFKALTLDFCERLRLPLPPLSEQTAASLRSTLPDFIPPTNPLDITAQGLVDPDIYRRSLPIVLADLNYGSVLLTIILTDETTSGLKLPPILQAIREIDPSKPVLFAALDEGATIDPKYVAELRSLGVPFFPTPERAFRAMAAVFHFFEQDQNDAQSGLDPEIPQLDAPEAGILPEYKSKHLLGLAGIPVPDGELAKTIQDAISIAQRIGYPVALKAQSKLLSHKSDSGGVALNIEMEEDLSSAWKTMHERIAFALPGTQLDGCLVESMGTSGFELIVGAHNDPEWGPVLLIGSGGVLAEALEDTRLLAPDLSQEAIAKELLLLKCGALLRGFRGSPRLDVEAAAAIVSRLGQLVLNSPQIEEVDINPVVVYPQGKGALALDALIVCKEDDKSAPQGRYHSAAEQN